MFEEFWALYTEAFPEQQRRKESQQRDLIAFEKKYHLEMIDFEGKIVGFLAYWDLESFIYIEHLAIDKSMRGKGLGGKVVKEFTQKWDKEILLEVEPPTDEISKKRIDFYKDLGFHLNHFPFLQPPYDPQYPQIPLLFMTYKQTYTRPAFSIFKTKLIYEVYKRKNYKTIR